MLQVLREVTRMPALRFLAALSLLPCVLFAFYGYRSGMPWDFSLTYLSESKPGLNGFLYRADELRIFTNVFYHLGYWLSRVLGLDGSWVGYHGVYAMLWAGRSIIVFAICRDLSLGFPVAASAALLTSAHGSDTSIGHVGQINQFGVSLFALLSIWMLIQTVQREGWRSWVQLVAAMFSAYMAMWSHEAASLGLLAAPIAACLMIATISRKAIVQGAVFTAVPATYLILFVTRTFLTEGAATYQNSVMSNDLRVDTFLDQTWFLLRGLIDPTRWLRKADYVICLGPSQWDGRMIAAILLQIAIAGTAVLVAARRPDALGGTVKRNRLLAVAVAAAGLAVAFLLPFSFLRPNLTSYWRTQIVAAPLMMVAISIIVHAGVRWLGGPATSCSQAANWTLVLGVVGFGITINTMSYERWERRWATVAQPIAAIIAVVPNVRPGTIVMLQDVPPNFAAVDSNYWFDILLRLAYPHTRVAGSYTLRYDQAKAAAIVAQGGHIISDLPNGKLIAPHGHLFIVSGTDVKLYKKHDGTLVDEASSAHLIALRWKDDGAIEIVPTPLGIAMATVTPVPDYRPWQNVLSGVPNAIATNRFGVYRGELVPVSACAP